jgi:hypothetical protein
MEMLPKPLAACSCKIRGGKIMALFIILPCMILQETKNGFVEPNARSLPIHADRWGNRF